MSIYETPSISKANIALGKCWLEDGCLSIFMAFRPIFRGELAVNFCDPIITQGVAALDITSSQSALSDEAMLSLRELKVALQKGRGAEGPHYQTKYEISENHRLNTYLG